MVSWDEWAKKVGKRLRAIGESVESLNRDTQAIWTRILRIEARIRTLEKPIVKTRILAFLAGEDKSRTEHYIARHVGGYDFAVFHELRQDGAFIETMSGFHHMYALQKCGLCRLISNIKAGRPIHTKVHFKDSMMVVVDCRTCKPAEPGKFQPKMVIYYKHGEAPSPQDREYMREKALALFPGRRIPLMRLTGKDHYHFFVR